MSISQIYMLCYEKLLLDSPYIFLISSFVFKENFSKNKKNHNMTLIFFREETYFLYWKNNRRSSYFET